MLGLLALGACNAIFGIEPGLPGGATGAGGGPSSSCGAPGTAEGTPRKLKASLSPGFDNANAVVHDAKDNLVVAGLFGGASLDLGAPLARVSSTEVENGFVIKYDSDGGYLWGQAFGGTKPLRLNAAGVDAVGNIYLTGAVAGKATIGVEVLDIASDASADNPDALVFALDPAGNVQWVKSFGNTGVQRGHRIAVDADGSSYVAGVSYDKVDFGDGNGPIGDAGGFWSFFLKLDPTGNLVWVRPFGSWAANLTDDNVEFFQIAVALDARGHAIVGSTFDGPILFGSDPETPAGGADAFVASLDVIDGKMLWYRTFHQLEGDAAPDGNQWISALTVDPCSGDIYAAGGFTRGIGFESHGGGEAIGDPDAPDIFLARLAGSNGAPIWARTYGDHGRQEVSAVKMAPDGTVILTGFLLSSQDEKGVDFGAPIGVLVPKPKASAPSGNADLFLLKVNGAGDNLWGIRRGDESAQAAFDVAVDSTGKIASCGITNGTLGLGGTAPAITSDTFDAFVARFDP